VLNLGFLVAGGAIHHEAVFAVITSIMVLAFGSDWLIHPTGLLVCFDAFAHCGHGAIFIRAYFGVGC
jgi:hypothetical protein